MNFKFCKLILKACWAIPFITFSLYAGIRQQVIITPDGYAYEKLKDGDTSYRIYKHNLCKNTKSLYEIKYDKSKCNIRMAFPDPTGNKIVLATLCDIFSKEGQGIYKFLIVDSKTNAEITSFNKFGIFAFSPKGDAIVYAEAMPVPAETPLPDDFKFYLYIYDFISKTSKKIDTLGVVPGGDYRPQDLNWSEHDGNIYYTDYDEVFRYNIKSGKGEIVTYKGIYFSADGKYYVAKVDDGPYWSIFKTLDNKEMSNWLDLIISEDSTDSGVRDFQFWSKNFNAVIFRISNTENVIFDVGKGKVIGKFYGGVLGTNADGSLVAVNPIKPDNPKAYDQTQVEIINIEEVVSKYQSK